MAEDTSSPQPVPDQPAEYVISLERVSAADRALVGGKAASLGEMRRAGLPVPAGFCVTTAAYRRFVAAAGLEEGLAAELAAMDALHVAEARAAAVRLREKLTASPIPAAVRKAVTDAWGAQWPGCTDVALAVRSSATAEDLPEASFAGQHDTYLNVTGEEALLRAIRDCWASLFTERALVYRARRKVDTRGVAMAVMVQEMAQADCAGVAFTADPMDHGPTRTDRIIIEAAKGLGEAIVSGNVSPDRIVVEKRSLAILERRGGVAPKEFRCGGNGEAVCLSAAQARALAELTLQAEQLFGMPQDVEWALAGERLWLLQSRPITALAPVAPLVDGADRAVWSNVNAGELLPEVVTPMAWSLIKRAVEEVFGRLLKILGVDSKREPWFALIAGRIYANLSIFVQLMNAVPGTSRMKLMEAFGGHGAGTAAIERILKSPDRRGLWRRRVGFLIGMPWLLGWLVGHLSVRRGRQCLAEYSAMVGRLRGFEMAGLSDADLAERFGTILGCLHEGSGKLVLAVVAHAGVGMAFTDSFLKATRRWLGDEHGAIANRLISGTGDMASAESALDLWRLAEWVRQRGAIAELLCTEANGGDLWVRLENVSGGREFVDRWRQWNARHGHHAYAEVDVAQPRWSERPDYVLALLRTYLASPADAGLEVREQRSQAEREALRAECRAKLNRCRRPVFDWLLYRSRVGLALRENLKNELIRVLAAARRVLLEAGLRLTQDGTLQTAEDVFFLEPEEVDRLLRGQREEKIVAAVAARKAEFARFELLRPPPVIVGRYDPERPGHNAGGCVPEAGSNVLRGLAVSAGVAAGPARVILRADSSELVQPGEILIAPFTDPGWTPHFLNAAGLVVDMGGMFSHGSVVAREYGLPAVVNVGTATRRIRTGQMVTVDGDRGVVAIGDVLPASPTGGSPSSAA
jgi:rifampicin phosphotransferase